jgi:hypothetical protein
MTWKKAGKALQFGLIFIIGGLIFILKHLPESIQQYISIQELSGIAVVAVGSLLFSLHKELLETKKGSSPLRHYDSLPKAIAESVNRRSKIGILRVLAQSSSHILPNIQGLLPRVHEAHVLLRMYETDDEVSKRERSTVERMVREWTSLESEGTIGTLKLTYYTGPPTTYFILIDRECAIMGCYFRNSDDITKNPEHIAPFIVDAKDEAGQRTIDHLVTWFDRYFDDWEKVSRKS